MQVKLYFTESKKTDAEGIKEWAEKEYASRVEAAVNLYVAAPELNMKRCAEAVGLECQRLSPVIRSLAEKNEVIARVYQTKTVEKKASGSFKPDKSTVAKLLKEMQK